PAPFPPRGMGERMLRISQDEHRTNFRRGLVAFALISCGLFALAKGIGNHIRVNLFAGIPLRTKT
ncbi:MAG TPA: hypothetical protein VMC10_25740, partial [Stellaceae bacterium]|nr:hypothetical protein [Stellaceae bacterium]